MTAQRDADVEALRKSTHRPLDVFFFVSIILILALSAVIAFVVITNSRHMCNLQDQQTSSQPAYNVRNCCCAQTFSQTNKDHFLIVSLNILLCCCFFKQKKNSVFLEPISSKFDFYLRVKKHKR